MGVQVNEPRRQVHGAVQVNGFARLDSGCSSVADEHNAITLNGDIGMAPGIAGAIKQARMNEEHVNRRAGLRSAACAQPERQHDDECAAKHWRAILKAKSRTPKAKAKVMQLASRSRRRA